jgi:uncharacterized protein
MKYSARQHTTLEPSTKKTIRGARVAPLNAGEAADNMITVRVVSAIAVLAVAPFNSPGAASFDCAKARSQAESLICSDSELSALDDELGVLHKRARAVAPDKEGFARSSRNEWQMREATCSTKACLLDWYAKRRVQLSQVIEQAAHSSEMARAQAVAPPPSSTGNCTNYENIDVDRCSKDDIYRAEKAFAERHTQWLYKEISSRTGPHTNRLAVTYSLNAVSFAPLPTLDYRRVTLSVIQGEGYRFVSITADSLINPGRLRYTEPDCPIAVRFDQGQLKYFSTTGQNGVSLTLISPDRFLADLRKASRAYIVFPLEELGNVTFEFDVSGYKW